jgi:hypothetical protein
VRSRSGPSTCTTRADADARALPSTFGFALPGWVSDEVADVGKVVCTRPIRSSSVGSLTGRNFRERDVLRAEAVATWQAYADHVASTGAVVYNARASTLEA